MEDHTKLKDKAINGVIWNLVDAIGRKGLVFVIQLVLARLIAPNEFGILGMVTVFISIAETIADCGMTNALIREKDTTQDEYSLVCFVNFFLSLVIYGVLLLGSNIIAEYYSESQLVKIIPVLGLVIIFNALAAVPRAIMIKRMLFRKQAIISVCSVAVAGIVAIIMAYKGLGIWALVVNNTLIAVFDVALCVALVRWFPSIHFKWGAFSKYFTFGWKVLTAAIISSVYENIYSIIIGRRYNADELGLYTNASKISSTIASAISQVAQKVSFPVMTEIQEEKDCLKNAYSSILKYSAFLCFPTMIGLLSISDLFVSGFLGDKWIPAIPYLKMLCIIGMMTPIHRINLNVLYVKGRSDLVLKLEIIKKAIGLALIGIACLIASSVMQMLIFSIIYEIVAFAINTHYSELLIGYSAKKQIQDLLPITIASSIMGVIIYVIHFMPGPWFLVLIVQIIVGIITYVIVIRIVERALYNDIIKIIKSFIVRGKRD